MKKYIAFMLACVGIMLLAACGKTEKQEIVSVQDSSDEDTTVSQEVEGAKEHVGEVTEESISNKTGTSVSVVGTRIEEQSFEVELDDWGTVTFAPYAPENGSFQPNGWNPDVRFYLMDDEQALYEFPGWNEEHTNIYLFLAVSAIAFEDYNDDGLLDVIALCEYETISGHGFQIARIYFQMKDKQGFEEDTLLGEYLTKNHHTDSIASILNAKEDYWDYVSTMDGHRSVYNEMLVMAENKDIWVAAPDYADEVYQYAVADLDRNGRHEIIVANHGGTGHYTYSRFFEINENYDGLTECETNFAEGDSQPDIISDELETYIDDQGQFHYAVYDLAKNGAGEYYENVRELVLKEGKITLVPIAYRTTIYQDGTHVITCKDSEGNVISEEDFENASKTYFTGYQEAVTKLGWQDVWELEDEVDKIVTQLQSSVEVFRNSTE